MKNKLLGLLIVPLLAACVWALEPKLQETFGVQQYFELVTSNTGAATVSGMMRSWSVRAKGGTVQFTIGHSTGTGFSVNTSSTIVVLDGQTVSDKNDGIMVNPVFTITSITQPACTAYLDISYLKQRVDGSQY